MLAESLSTNFVDRLIKSVERVARMFAINHINLSLADRKSFIYAGNKPH